MNDSPPSLFASLRALPRSAWILFFGTFLNKFGTFVVPFLTLYLTKQGYTPGEAGLALSAYGVGNLAASILGGHLADVLGRRKTIMLSMFSGAVAMLLLSQARSMPLIIGLVALTGLAGELYRPASSALLADLVPSQQRVTAYAAYRAAFNAGWAFGPATAGFLVERGYFWLFAGDAATSILFGLVAFFALPRGARGAENNSHWREVLGVLRRDRTLHRVLAAALCIGFVFFQMSSSFGLYVTHLGFSAAAYGVIISLNGALIVFFELPLTSLTQRFPARRVMAVGYVLIGTGFAMNALAHTIPALIGCMLIFTLGEMMAMPVTAAYIADLAPANMRGRYMGTYSFTWAIGLIFGPAAGMALFSLNPSLPWICCGSLAVVAAAVILGDSSPSHRPDVISLAGKIQIEPQMDSDERR